MAAAGRYDGALRQIVHAFKYRRTAVAGAAARRDAESRRCGMAAHHGLRGARPLYPWRRLRRGFNQAADLARQLDLPVVHALWRTRATAPQTGLTAAARRRNVAGAFRLSPLLSRRTRALISDRVVVLVDDVMTTGATMQACAEVLASAGAREVRMLTVARA